MAHLGSHRPQEQIGRRPVIVWQSDELSRVLQSVLVVPLTTNLDRARLAGTAATSPELAVLSVLAHGHDDVGIAVKVALAAMSGVTHVEDRDRFVLYRDLILAALSDAARKALQMIPEGYQFQSPIIRESIEKGINPGASRRPR